jgi:hypothetical protein
MATITITLNDEQLAPFREAATLLGVAPEEVARRSVEEFLARKDAEFEQIVAEVVSERAEVLRRLAR